MRKKQEPSDSIPDNEELESKTRAELIEALRENTQETARLRRQNQDAMGGGILDRARRGDWPMPAEKPAEEAQTQAPKNAARPRDADTARQVLAAYYMLKALGVRFDITGNKKRAISLIAATVSRHEQTVKVALQNVEDGGAEREDLEYILPLFRL